MEKIFVMGGGGFAMEPENLLLDKYILSLAEKKTPSICFLGTASGDSESYRERFYNSYRTLDCQPTHYSVFKPTTRDLIGFFSSQDIIHVGGGNTKNLLCLWREWGIDKALVAAYKNGTVLTGMSAGMICWFEQGVTDSYGDGLEPLNCLGLLEGSACPHFDGEADRKPSYLKLIKEKKIRGGIALDDGVGALYINGKPTDYVSSRPSAKAYGYESETANEQVLRPTFLGK